MTPHWIRIPRRLLRAAVALLTLTASAVRAQTTPLTGRELLEAMHAAYAGRWFTSLTFTQQTTTRAADGKESVATWYESLRYTDGRGTQLRIDTGEPSAGNGVLYTGDSLWSFRAGKQVAARSGGNALLPLIEGVYVQPVARTVAELKPTGVDLSRAVLNGRWHDRPVWIAGASSVADTTSPQIWTDTATKAVVRAIFKPVPSAPLMDIRLDSLVSVAGGWLATRCEFFVNGKLTQLEEYQNWRANVDLSPALFDAATWSTAPHWAPTPPAATEAPDAVKALSTALTCHASFDHGPDADFARGNRSIYSAPSYRQLGLGVFGDLATWNPGNLSPEKNAFFNERTVVVSRPPFTHGQWTHVAITFAGLNGQAGGTAKLYLNGQLMGTATGIREPFTWDVSKATIRLGVNFVGLWDDLSLYDRAMSDAEVGVLYRLDGGAAALHTGVRQHDEYNK